MWALARCSRPPSRSLVRALRTHLDSSLQQQDTQGAAQGTAVGSGGPGSGQPYSGVQLAAVAGACQKLGVVDRQLSWQLATAGAQVSTCGRAGVDIDLGYGEQLTTCRA